MKKRPFIVLYFTVIFLVFLAALLRSPSPSFNKYYLGSQADTRYELKDDSNIAFVFQISQNDLIGLYLNDYSSNGLTFKDEYIEVSVTDYVTMEQYQAANVRLSDQISEKNIFIPFDREYAPGTKLLVQLKSHGLFSKGILLGLSKTKSYGNITWIKGRLQKSRFICVSLLQKTFQKDYLTPVLYLLAELLFGAVLIILSGKKGLPVFNRQKPGRPEGLFRSGCFSFKELAVTAAGMVCILGFSLLLWDYVYTYAIETTLNRYTASFSFDPQTVRNQAIHLEDDTPASALLLAEKDHFSGIGVYLADISGKGILSFSLENARTGELLVEKKYTLSALEDIADFADLSDYYSSTEITSAVSLDDCYRLDFQTELPGSKDTAYRVTLMISQSGGAGVDLLTAQNSQSPVYINGTPSASGAGFLLLYQNNWYFKKLFMGIAILLILVLECLFLIGRFTNIRTHLLFPAAFLILGIVYSIIIPPYCVPDERSHIDTAYRISNEIMGISDLPGPNEIWKRACDIDSTKDNTMSVTTDLYRELFSNLFGRAEDETLRISSAGDSLSNVTVFNYLPAALGFTAARLLHRNMQTMIMFGRWFNILVISLLLFLAVHHLRTGKELFIVLALTPMFLQQCASCSYDGTIFACTYVFISYCLGILSDEQVCLMDMLILFISGGILASCKGGVYIPVLGLLLLLPFTRAYQNMRSRFSAAIVGITTLAGIGMFFISRFAVRILQMFSRQEGSAVRSIVQGNVVKLVTFGMLLRNPVYALRLFENTIYQRGDILLNEILGSRLAFLNVRVPWFVLSGFLILAVLSAAGTALTDANGRPWRPIYRLYTGLLCLAGTIMIMLSMLLAWTTLDSDYILGLQGRYFIPYLGLILLIVFGQSPKEKTRCNNTSLLSVCLLQMAAIGCIFLSVLG